MPRTRGDLCAIAQAVSEPAPIYTCSFIGVSYRRGSQPKPLQPTQKAHSRWGAPFVLAEAEGLEPPRTTKKRLKQVYLRQKSPILAKFTKNK